MQLGSLNLHEITNRSATSVLRSVDQARGTDGNLRKVAEEFEAVFATEMLKHAGVGKPRESFGGGVGEEGFSTFLTQEYANVLVQRGGFGLADHIYSALAGKVSK